MRRSRASLLLFFGTFATLLLAVGFADGGHESTGRPIDMYRLDIDEAADGWQCPGSLGCADDLLVEVTETAIATVKRAEAPSIAGAEGWILMPMPGMPLVMVLYLDDETACDLACGSPAPAVDNATAYDAPAAEATIEAACTDLVGCIVSPWPCSQALAAYLVVPQVDAVDEMNWRNEAAITAVKANDAATLTSDELVFGAAAAFGGVPHDLVWSQAIEHSTRCEFAWGNCGIPANPAIAVWIDDRANLPLAEFCRETGRAVWHVVHFLNSEREATIAAASRELAIWLPKLAEQGGHAAARHDLENDRSTSAIRVSGTLIAL